MRNQTLRLVFIVLASCSPTRPATEDAGGAETAVPRDAATHDAPSFDVEPARRTALADLDPRWIERTLMGNMYDGSRVYSRNRTMGSTGVSTHENTHPVIVVLGNRSGSHGADADRDGLSDMAEAAIHTNPNAFDTDGDGVPDAFELFATHTDPRVADSDGDGMNDGAEIDLDDPDAYADDDHDGFCNAQETAGLGSDPHNADSDGDGIDDLHEFYFGTAINDRAHPEPDHDHDGEPDAFEMANGTDPEYATSEPADGDGDSIADWLDPDTVVMASVRGRRATAAITPALMNGLNDNPSP